MQVIIPSLISDYPKNVFDAVIYDIRNIMNGNVSSSSLVQQYSDDVILSIIKSNRDFIDVLASHGLKEIGTMVRSKLPDLCSKILMYVPYKQAEESLKLVMKCSKILSKAPGNDQLGKFISGNGIYILDKLQEVLQKEVFL